MGKVRSAARLTVCETLCAVARISIAHKIPLGGGPLVAAAHLRARAHKGTPLWRALEPLTDQAVEGLALAAARALLTYADALDAPERTSAPGARVPGPAAAVRGRRRLAEI